MRTLLFTGLLVGAVPWTIAAQTAALPTYDAARLADYHSWFDLHSQARLLETNNAKLYVFTPNTPVRSAPDEGAPALTHLAAGTPVGNIVEPRRTYRPRSTQRGYTAYWYQVNATSPDGRHLNGYVWGGHLAQAWQDVVPAPNEAPALLLLGLADNDRSANDLDIRAALRLVRHSRVIAETDIPGLCLFLECHARAVLQTQTEQPRSGYLAISAGTLITGCTGGIEKAIYVYREGNFRPVHHAEYLTGYRFSSNVLDLPAGDGRITRCVYGGEDRAFVPRWDCRELTLPPNPPVAGAVIRAAP